MAANPMPGRELKRHSPPDLAETPEREERRRRVAMALFGDLTDDNRFSTPNKIFECLAAGTPVVARDFPTLRRIIVDYPGGPLAAVCDPSDVQAIAASIRSLMRLTPDEMAALRERCRLAVEERWNWGREAQALLAIYTKILSRSQGDLSSGGSTALEHLA